VNTNTKDLNLSHQKYSILWCITTATKVAKARVEHITTRIPNLEPSARLLRRYY